MVVLQAVCPALPGTELCGGWFYLHFTGESSECRSGDPDLVSDVGLPFSLHLPHSPGATPSLLVRRGSDALRGDYYLIIRTDGERRLSCCGLRAYCVGTGQLYLLESQ